MEDMNGEAEILAVAVDLASRAHRGQPYPAPEPELFIQHPLRVMNALHGARAQAAALLHDVLEDTTMTADELRAADLPVEVVEAVIALTRPPAETYEQYIERVALNDIAREVKLANLANNRRLPKDPEALARIERYERAIRRLKPRTGP
jgi:(p)ppGpp synthase/HD superfamily hydrolase